MDITSTLALNNGVHIPVLGLGTWLSEPGEVKVAVEFALKQGYKHVDCAAIYFNEKVPHTNMMWDVYVQVQITEKTLIVCWRVLCCIKRC